MSVGKPTETKTVDFAGAGYHNHIPLPVGSVRRLRRALQVPLATTGRAIDGDPFF